MSWLVLRADAAATVLADDPVVPAAAIARFRDAAALFDEAAALRDASAARVAAEVADARAAAVEKGLSEGRAAAKAESEAELFRLLVAAADERRRVRAEVTTLALEVVRRIAGELAADTMTVALADRATHDLLPDAIATVRVAPQAVAATRARLATHPNFTIEADPEIGPVDCVVETPLGVVHAGLETQLAAIAHAWASTGRENADAA